MVEDTWFRRDLPVLDAIVTSLDKAAGRAFPQLEEIAQSTGLDLQDVSRAAQALDGVYIDLQKRMGPPGHWHVRAVSPEARAATGQWPTAETLAARIIKALEDSAAAEPDIEKRGRLRSAASALRDTAKDVGTNVLTAVILRSTGLS